MAIVACKALIDIMQMLPSAKHEEIAFIIIDIIQRNGTGLIHDVNWFEPELRGEVLIICQKLLSTAVAKKSDIKVGLDLNVDN